MKNKIAIGVVLSCLLAGTELGYFVLKSQEEHLVLENDTIQVELGSDSYLNIEDFVGDKMTDKAQEKVVLSAKLSENKDGKVLPGTYEVLLKYKPLLSKEEVERGYLIIADTKSPKFETEYETLYVEQNAKNVDLRKYFKVKDESTYTLIINAESIDMTQCGTYSVEIIARDKYNNESKTTVNIKVVSAEDIQAGYEALTPYLDGTTPVSKETQKLLDRGILFDVNTKKRRPQVVKEEPKPLKEEEEKTKEDKKEEKKKSENTTPQLDACALSVPPEGILTKEDAIKSAEQYLEMTGLTGSHTYRLNTNKVACGQTYFTYSIVLKDNSE